MDSDYPDTAFEGEWVTVLERIIVATAPGRFRPTDDRSIGSRRVRVGEVLGELISGGLEPAPVKSPFEGTLMGFLASDGERLAVGQPIAWLRTTVEDTAAAAAT